MTERWMRKYLATHIGGGNHRLFDGEHTLAGAYEAVRAASPDDSLIEEGLGFVQGMFRDLTTTKGLPLANWDKGPMTRWLDSWNHGFWFRETGSTT